MSENKKVTDQTEDPELNDLLDSALEDFDSAATEDTKKNADSSTSVSKKQDEVVDEVVPDEEWTNDFLKQVAVQFERNIQTFIQNGEEADLGTSIQRMAESVANAITENESGDGDTPNADFQSAIAQSLRDLSSISENLQNDADLAAMLSQTSLEEGAGDILPFMQGMMQSLLSKEILYPSLKELVEKYPGWLEEKKTTLPAADLERYKKQLELMQKVCTELEKEKDNDSEEIKKQRFDVILSLMQEMQSNGPPPEELVGEQPALFQFDNNTVPTVPGLDNPQNCSVM